MVEEQERHECHEHFFFLFLRIEWERKPRRSALRPNFNARFTPIGAS
jgi:hypothetical protein